MGREGAGPVIWDFVKVVWGLAVGWVMGDTCGVGGLSCWGDGQVFVGDIPSWVTAQSLYKTSEMWNYYYGTDIPLRIDFNFRRGQSASSTPQRPLSATLTFPAIECATRWIQRAKQYLRYSEGRCKVQYVHYEYQYV